MAIDFDDLDTYFADFGVPAIIANDYNDDTETITGIFNGPEREIYQVDQLNTNPKPTLLVKTEDVVSLERGKIIEVDGTAYSILAIEPDGTGLTVITLEEIPDDEG